MKNLIFVDTLPHYIKSKELLDYIEYESTFITTEKEIFLKMKDVKSLYLPKKNFIKQIQIILKIRRSSYTSISIARTDSLLFQVLYMFCSFREVFTFDEGLYSLNKLSIYNSQFKIDRKFHTKFFLLNKLTNFPIPAAFFYKKNTRHYTWFPLSAFSDSIIDLKKIIQIKTSQNKEVKKIKIMIGQPWQFMFLNDAQMKRIFDFVNSANINIYLLHPKEDNEFCTKYLSDNISILHAEPNAEIFLRNINIIGLEIFTLTSTLACNIPKNVAVNIIKVKEMHERIIFDQEVLLETLHKLNKPYMLTQID